MTISDSSLNEISPITATVVPDSERLDFFPTYFGKYFSAGENLLYVLARKFVKDYDGGYWNFYTLSNGGFFVALDTDKKLNVVVPGNYCSELMCAESAGITLMLFVLGRLCGARIPEAEAERFIELYHKLRQYALAHAESQAILTAID